MSTRNFGSRPGRWAVPGACVVFGVAFLVIGLATDQIRFGVTGITVMLAYGAVLVIFRRRGEPAALLAGDVSDERRAHIQLQAAAVTGRVLIVAVVAGVIWGAATQSRYEAAFSALAAIGGLTLLTSTVWLSRRA